MLWMNLLDGVPIWIIEFRLIFAPFEVCGVKIVDVSTKSGVHHTVVSIFKQVFLKKDAASASPG